MTVLFDTNVLIDIFKPDPDWLPWSLGMLDRYSADQSVVIVNAVVVAEFLSSHDRSAIMRSLLLNGTISYEAIPMEAGMLAGRAYRAYLSRGGTKRNALSDYLIGAHAVVEKHVLVTRDPARYRTAFPELKIVSP